MGDDHSLIQQQEYRIRLHDRNKLNGHHSLVIWLTGLSGAGKSTLAGGLEKSLYERRIRAFVLDGDNIRRGLNRDLDFSNSCRNENIRRVAEVAKLMTKAGLVVIAAFISPFRRQRESLRKLLGDLFVEVFVDTPLDVCEKRDAKGLYAKARRGEIASFTGISSPFESPVNPDIHIYPAQETYDESLEKILAFIQHKLSLDYEW